MGEQLHHPGLTGPLSRRAFLTAVVVGAVAASCSSDDDTGAGATSGPTTTGAADASTLPIPELSASPFTLGVASGDPLPDSVILWTRLAPEPLDGGGMPDGDAPVEWEVATDEEFADIVQSGTAVASAALGHSVHVDATGLDPDAWYWFRFRVGAYESPVGRTRTAPAADAAVEQLTFAFASCQHWEDGYWTAYAHLAEEADLDLVVFLGDYIYEGDADPEAVRQHNSDEVVNLVGYRNRYALYKSDENLLAVHALVPWVITWDDHEVDNNYAGNAPDDEAIVGPDGFADRRAAAYQAWYEHHPVRLEPPVGDAIDIHRSFGWGALAELFVLDTRQHRTDQGCGDATLDLAPACDDILDPERTMLGAEQETWLIDGLGASTATWKVLANSVVFGNTMIGEAVINYDQWDGYPASRQAILQKVVDDGITGLVVVTGDIHFSAAGNLRLDQADPTSPIIASEFVGTSIGSDLDEGLVDAVAGLADLLNDVLYANGAKRGYVLCTVTPESWRTDYRVVESTAEPTSPISTDATFVIQTDIPGASPV